jgi:NADH-quinone oxidoreductase subunit G
VLFRSGDIEVVYLLGVDEIDMARLGPNAQEGAFVIYQGHHGDAGAHRADVILPGAAYTEKNGTYVNTEGRVQLGRLAVSPPGEAREDWTILRALSEVVGERLPYDDLGALRRRLVEVYPTFATVDRAEPAPWGEFGEKGELDGAPFAPAVENFYMTDPISRASETMASCAEAFGSGRPGEATGTDG